VGTGDAVAAELDLLDRGVGFAASSCIVGDAVPLIRCFLVGLSRWTSIPGPGPLSLHGATLVMPASAASNGERH